MRSYSIYLKSDKKKLFFGFEAPNIQQGNQLTLQQNMFGMKDNIHIEFETVSYLETNSTKAYYDTAVLALHNVNKYWHNENADNKINGAKITIYGGVKATPIQYTQGLVDPLNTCYALNDGDILRTPLYEGYVANTYANMNGATNILIMNLHPLVELDKGKPINQINIKFGTDWRQEVIKFINAYNKRNGSKDIAVLGIPSRDSVLIADDDYNTEDINGIFTCKSGTTLAEFVKTTFNEVLYKVGNVVYLGKSIPHSISVIKISDKDLLGQPQMVSPRKIQVYVPLCNKFRLSQKIVLNIKGFVGYNQVTPFLGDPSNFGLTLGYNKEKMYAGIYILTGIRHVMASRTPGPESWCTILEMVEDIA